MEPGKRIHLSTMACRWKLGINLLLSLTVISLGTGAAASVRFPITARITAQPTPLAPQAADQDCEKIKKDIEQLQEELAKLPVEMQRVTDQLNRLDNSIAKAQADFRSRSFVFAGEAVRGQYLDAIAKMLNLRKQLKQQLEDDASLMQAIKEEIADLLNKLGNCGPPSTTEPPKGTLRTQPLPPSNPPPPSPPVSPGLPSPQTPAPGQQAADQDCEKIKKDIEQLQEELAKLSVEMQRVTDQLNRLDNSIAKAQADFRSRSFVFAGEAVRGQYLDAIAKMLNLRKQLKQQLEDDASLMQAIKDEIADLLNKLANCPPPSTTEPPKQEPPKENKQVGMGQPGPPKPLVSMQVGGGVGFNNIGGSSGDRAAFLNSFPGGTFSTSANTFAGNVGSSIGIGPAVFDFDAWRASGNNSNGSGPVLGGGTDTAHITQQFQGISVTAGPKIPLGGKASLIIRGGGNFWHSNIDTKETVGGTTSSTATNSRGIDGTGWTTGAALQWDFAPRWSAVVRWDYLAMNNAGVNVHLNQGSVGVMFRLFGVPGK